ncbi:hypothetical protein WBN73_05555 [Paenarthrobacter sp. CCNWLY172]|uniref:hypothetical protein n=1 Tax=unclassified Paenarthrobacter TaxID=2634190 RepID=UPI0030784C08
MSVHSITVVCRDPRHPKGQQKLLTLQCVRPDRPGYVQEDEWAWSPKPTHTRSSIPGRNQASHGYDDWWKEAMKDPDFLPNPPKHGDGSAGIKTVFECTRCGSAFAASNKEKLDAVLTKCWENNLAEIPLDFLRRAYNP